MAEIGGLGTAGALSLSVISSVAIVICNKTLISNLGFCFGMVAFPHFFEELCFFLRWLRDLNICLEFLAVRGRGIEMFWLEFEAIFCYLVFRFSE